MYEFKKDTMRRLLVYPWTTQMCANSNKQSRYPERMSSLLSKYRDNRWYKIITYSQDWANTPQGDVYWRRIFRRNEDQCTSC